MKASKEKEPRMWPSVKVDRVCPRCGFHTYHWANVRGIRHRIECTNCGHEWKGRVRREEME